MNDSTNNKRNGNWHRRKFVGTVVKAITAAPLLSIPLAGFTGRNIADDKIFTVQEVIDMVLTSIPGAPFPKTVDTIKSGDVSQQVTGVVTTMFATDAVIEQTARLGANFIIAHEPTFYNHPDDVAWLKDDEVYLHKKDLLEKNKIVVWRFHDYIHSHKPDGVLIGVIDALGWHQYYDEGNPHILTIPGTSLKDLISTLKNKLGIDHLKFIGNPSQQCKKIALMPGASGGTSQINMVRKEKPDVLICGEINEWETAEYIRDLRRMGGNTSLIILGHAVSEEPGLEWLVNWLKPQLKGLKITHVPSPDPFNWA